MIRPATVDDIPALLAMGKAFADDAGVTARTGWDNESVTALLKALIDSPDGIVLISSGGMIGGYVSGHPFNQNSRMFVELFWRAQDGSGLALLNAAEAQAKKCGATKSIMVAMNDMDRTRRLYNRIGYEPVEAQFIKDLI